MDWKKRCVLGLAAALSLGIGAYANAAVLGCAANDITMWSEQEFIDDAYTTSSEEWQIIIGDPIIIGVGSQGSKALWMCMPDPGPYEDGKGIYRQYYSTSAWGTNVWLNGTDATKHFYSPYYSGYSEGGALPFAEGSTHSKSVSGDTTTVTTEMVMGSYGTLRQIITYKAGSYGYSTRWEILNTSGGALSDVRFFHGGDTYFGYDDSATSWYDAARRMVYVSNPDFDISGIMGFYASELTPSSHYWGGSYWQGGEMASGSLTIAADPDNPSYPVGTFNARLADYADPSYLDAGYQLEWDRPTLANNETFIIEATEIVTDPTPVAVLAPSNQSTGKNVTTTLDFVVQNLDSTNENPRVTPTTAHTFNLTAQSSQGWNVEIVGPTQVALGYTDRVTVPVRVTVPGSVSNGVEDNITLRATDSSDTLLFGTGTAKLTVVSTNYEISATNLNFNGNTRRRVITIRNNHPAGREGVSPLVAVSGLLFGQVGGSNPLESPFSIGDDTCSNQEIPEGSECTIEVLFSPEGDGTFDDSFNIPVLSPVAQNWTIDVTGIAGQSLKTEKINYGCFIDSLTR